MMITILTKLIVILDYVYGTNVHHAGMYHGLKQKLHTPTSLKISIRASRIPYTLAKLATCMLLYIFRFDYLYTISGPCIY